MKIRVATAEDIPAYFEHTIRHFRESGRDGDLVFHPVLDFEEWKKEEHVAKTMQAMQAPLADQEWQRIWIAETDGLIVADAMLRASHMAATAHRCQFGIGIERKYRGQGLGHKLSELAISWAELQPGIDWIDLWVFEHNAPARRLYERLGFTATDTVQDQFRIHGQKVADTQMTYRLKR